MENSAFMFLEDFYPKPRITLLDAELSPKTQQQLETVLEEFSGKLSKRSSDTDLTDLKEMVLQMKPGSIPVVSKPYWLPSKHHSRRTNQFVRDRTNRIVFKSLCCTNYGSAT